MYRYACGWRQLEGLIMLAGVGAKFWVIVEFSGVAGVINGLSNAYFGLWGTFFSEYGRVALYEKWKVNKSLTKSKLCIYRLGVWPWNLAPGKQAFRLYPPLNDFAGLPFSL